MSEAQPDPTPSDPPANDPPANDPPPAEPPPPAAARTEHWYDGFSPDLQAHPTVQKYGSAEDAAKALVEAQRFIGGEKIPVPNENWQESDWDAFHNALGRPETPQEYELADYSPPEGVPWDNGFFDSMIEGLHKAGLSQRQLRAVLDHYNGAISEQWNAVQEAHQRANEDAQKAIRTEWGNAYDANVDLGNRALVAAAGKDAEALLQLELGDGTRLGNHPAFVKAMATIGSKFSEHGIEGDKNVHFTMTPDEAKAEIERLMKTEDFQKALFDDQHPEHKAAVQKREGLYKMAYPS